jgi:hypothetical protein
MKFRVFWDAVPYSHAEKLTDISEVHLPPSSGVEAVYTSETSVNFNVTTRCYIPEDSNFQFSTWIHFHSYTKDHSKDQILKWLKGLCHHSKACLWVVYEGDYLQTWREAVTNNLSL